MAEVRTRAENTQAMFTVTLIQEVCRGGDVLTLIETALNHPPMIEKDAIAFAREQQKASPNAVGYGLRQLKTGANYA